MEMNKDRAINSAKDASPVREKQGKLDLIASQKLEFVQDTYKIIDFLNRNLKEYNLLFGLTKEDDSMKISIYEVE